MTDQSLLDRARALLEACRGAMRCAQRHSGIQTDWTQMIAALDLFLSQPAEKQPQPTKHGNLDAIAEQRNGEQQRRDLSAGFRVSVETMRESNGKVTHMVCIDRPDRPLDANPWDEGRITPYSSTIRERVTAEAAVWQDFLNAPQIAEPPSPQQSASPRPSDALASSVASSVDAQASGDGRPVALPNDDNGIPSHHALADHLRSMLANGSTKCPLCGNTQMHEHSPVELVIYRNGVKYGRSLTHPQPPREGKPVAWGVIQSPTKVGFHIDDSRFWLGATFGTDVEREAAARDLWEKLKWLAAPQPPREAWRPSKMCAEDLLAVIQAGRPLDTRSVARRAHLFELIDFLTLAAEATQQPKNRDATVEQREQKQMSRDLEKGR